MKLKENFDNAILDKLIDTNEKVDISYKAPDNKEESKTSNITPVLEMVRCHYLKYHQYYNHRILQLHIPSIHHQFIVLRQSLG